MPCLVCRNAPKRDTGGHILTEWPFCHVKSDIEHKRRYLPLFMCSEATEWGLWPHLHTVETVYLFPDFFTSLWICLVLTTGCSPEYLYYHDDVDQVSLLRQQLVSDLV